MESEDNYNKNAAWGHILCSNWIATRFEEEAIVKILDLHNPVSITFEEGLSTVHVNNRDKYPDVVLITPAIEGWTLIMGRQLTKMELSKDFCEKLSRNGKIFSFGIDDHADYRFWMFAENGVVKRYVQHIGEEDIQFGEAQEFEKLIEDSEYSDSILVLSKEFGFDMNKLESKELLRRAKLWKY